MIENTKGVVLRTIKYSETSIIAQIYTQVFGLESFMINGVRQTKAKHARALLQPLSLLEMVVYYKANRDIQRMKEYKSAYVFQSVPFDTVKSVLALFMAEVLYKSVKEEVSNKELFEFIEQCIQQLDQQTEGLAYQPLLFLIRLSHYLGFYPNNNYLAGERSFFDLQEGVFVDRAARSPRYMQTDLAFVFHQLLKSEKEPSPKPTVIARKQRQVLLSSLLRFYDFHVSNFGVLNSVSILREVLS